MKFSILLCFSLVGMSCLGQKKDKPATVFIYDSSWNSIVDITKAIYLTEVIEENDTSFVARTYQFSGPMIVQESYRDKELSVTHGFFVWYDSDGKIDSSGYVFNGKKDGDWYKYNDDLEVVLKSTYYRGKWIETKTYNSKEKNNVTTDSVLVNDEKVAEFKGGLKALGKFLSAELIVPQRLSNLKKFGTVKASFYIDTLGWVQNVYIVKSIEWSADKEVIRVINKMPQWTPATHKGRKVKYSCIQPIIFPDEK